MTCLRARIGDVATSMGQTYADGQAVGIAATWRRLGIPGAGLCRWPSRRLTLKLGRRLGRRHSSTPGAPDAATWRFYADDLAVGIVSKYADG